MLRFTRFALSELPAAKFLKTDINKGVALVTFTRGKMNPLNGEVAAEMATTFEALDAHADVGCIVITGNPEGKAFVAGADIKEMAEKQFVDWHNYNMFENFDRILKVKKPTIAAVNGYALGGGCELAMMMDIIVASDKAIFGQPEIKIGTIPGMGGTQRLTSLIGKSKAMEWCLTGRQYSAEEAERAGLVARVVKAEELLPTSLKLGQEIASYSRVATSLCKDAINKSLESSLNEGLAYEKARFQTTFATADQKEGMKAFVEKRAPSFQHK